MAPTRVLIFCPTLGSGGADRVVVTLISLLDRERFRIVLVLMRKEGELISEIPDDVEVHVLGSRRLAVAAPALARAIRAIAPDVVFSTHGGSNIIVAIAHALARSTARLVLSERSSVIRPDRSRARLALELPAKRLTYRRADRVTAVSQGVADQLAHLIGVPRTKLQVVFNPMVNPDLADLAAEPVDHAWFAPGQTKPIVLAIGRLVEIKDYPTLLAAFAKVWSRQAARLVILGDGPLRASLEANARCLGIDADVAFLGFDRNPFKYMARARCVLHASRAEGLPGALIQAMACGTPVVSTDCDVGPREVITSGRDGYLVPVGDANALADRVSALLTDDALARTLGAAARVSAQRFTAAAALGRYEAALEGEVAT